MDKKLRRNEIRLSNGDLLYFGETDYIKSVFYDYKDQGFIIGQMYSDPQGLIVHDRKVNFLSNEDLIKNLLDDLCDYFSYSYMVTDYYMSKIICKHIYERSEEESC